MDPVQVISLRRCPERRARFVEANAHLNHVFVDAVDANAMDAEAIADPRCFASDLRYSAGARGAALSHRMLWLRCAGEGVPMTVAEDDAVFRFDFNAEHDRILQSLPAHWDLILWGWNFDFYLTIHTFEGGPAAVLAFDQASGRNHVDRFQASSNRPGVFPLRQAWGLPAYTISARGAEKYLSRVFPLDSTPIRIPVLAKTVPSVGIDGAMNNLHGNGLDAFVSFPPLVFTPNDHDASTVREAGSAKGILARVWKRSA